MRIAEIVRTLEDIGAPYALIGAHAMAARGYPRFTVDVDFLTTDARVFERTVWSEIERLGGTIDARHGDPDDPLGGVVHIRHADGSEADVILARWKWQADVIQRAERLELSGLDIPVPRTSDLILLKLAAGGQLDMRDAAVLLELGDRKRVVSEVEAHLGEVRPDIGPRWRDLLASTR